jgi:RNA polymerase sigma-70 factor (ECF subfamily)
MLKRASFPETRPSLLAKLGNGAPQQLAWREFFELYAPAVYHVARYRGLDAHDAEDIVQQVMIAIAGHLDGFCYDRDRGRFRNWVRTVAENKIATACRRNKLPISPGDPDNRPAEAAWSHEWHMQDLLWCLEQVSLEVSPKRMAIFRLYSIEGMSAEQVAERLNTTVGYVYVTRHLVLSLMRRKMDAIGVSDGGQ